MPEVSVNVGRGNLEAYGAVRFENSVQEKEFNGLIQKIISTNPKEIKDLMNNFGEKIKDEATLNSLRKLLSNAIWKRYNKLNGTDATINQAQHGIIAEQITRLRVALINLDTDLLKKVRENQASTTAPAEEAQPVGDKAVVIKGRKFILMVGINDYINPAIGDLKCCENDVNGMQQCLGDKWKGASVTKLLSRNATKANIRKWFLGLKDQLKAGDQVLFVYSGHGTNDGNDGYLCPADTNVSDRSTLISGKELATWRGLLGSATTAFVIDSCFSGEIPGDFESYKTMKKTKYSNIKFLPVKFGKKEFSKKDFNKHNEFYKKLAGGNYKGLKSVNPTIIATASSADQYSQEDPEFTVEGLSATGYGAFMGWLMRGLGVGNTIGKADTNKSKGISLAGEAYKWAYDGVTSEYSQTPQIFYSGPKDGEYYNWSIKGANEKKDKPVSQPAEDPTRDPVYVKIEQASGPKEVGDAPKAKAAGKVFVLSIGVNKYSQNYQEKYHSQPNNLNWCVKDAQDIGKAFQSSMCPPENVTFLMDEQATWANVQQSVEDIKKKMGPNDKLVIYSSSHGTNDGNEGYICLYDTMVSGTALGELRDKVGKNEVAFIFDSCQNGALIGKGSKKDVAVSKNAKYFRYNNSKDDFISAQSSMVKKFLRPDTFVFTSCRGDEYSEETDALKHGTFTYVLLQALTMRRPDGTYEADNLPYTMRKPDGNISMEELVKLTAVGTVLLTTQPLDMRGGATSSGATQHPQYVDNNRRSQFVVKASE